LEKYTMRNSPHPQGPSPQYCFIVYFNLGQMTH
jgi:hypothetical protein